MKGRGTLTLIQKNLLTVFSKVKDASFFYLTGGTALSEFYLGHRRSYDLDFFTGEKDLITPFSRVLEGNLDYEEYTLKVIRRFESFVEYEVNKVNETLRLHFAYYNPFISWRAS